MAKVKQMADDGDPKSMLLIATVYHYGVKWGPHCASSRAEMVRLTEVLVPVNIPTATSYYAKAYNNSKDPKIRALAWQYLNFITDAERATKNALQNLTEREKALIAAKAVLTAPVKPTNVDTKRS